MPGRKLFGIEIETEAGRAYDPPGKEGLSDAFGVYLQRQFEHAADPEKNPHVGRLDVQVSLQKTRLRLSPLTPYAAQTLGVLLQGVPNEFKGGRAKIPKKGIFSTLKSPQTTGLVLEQLVAERLLGSYASQEYQYFTVSGYKSMTVHDFDEKSKQVRDVQKWRVAVAGDLSSNQALGKILYLLSRQQSPVDIPNRTPTLERVGEKRFVHANSFTHIDPKIVKEQGLQGKMLFFALLHGRSGHAIAFSIKGPPENHADHPAFALLCKLLDERLERRLVHAGSKRRGLVYEKSGKLKIFGGDHPSLFFFTCLMREVNGHEVIKAIEEEIQALANEKFSQEVIDATATQLQIEAAIKNNSLSGWLDMMRHSTTRARSVSVACLSKVAKQYFGDAQQGMLVTLNPSP